MALRLKSIRLQNWKCYRDVEINFNLKTPKKIWIVFGQNGFGKTSLLEAIQWCLYGNAVVSAKELLKHFHRVASKKRPEFEMSVNLTFDRDGDIFQISRVAQRLVKGATLRASVGEAMVLENGINKTDVRERIEELLPKSCKEFFFFDGVEIKRYAQSIHTEETYGAIERILGIPELRNLRDDAKIAGEKIEKRINDLGKGNKALRQIKEELRDLREQIEVKKGQLKKAENEQISAIKNFNSVKEEANQNEDLHQILEELKNLESTQGRYREDLDKSEKEVKNALRQAPIPLLLEFVREVADDMQTTTTIAARRSGSVALLEEILRDETCVCGRCLDEESRQFILEELETFKTRANSSTNDVIKQDGLRNRLETLSGFQTPDFDGLLFERDRLQDELEEAKQTMDRLRRETRGQDDKKSQEIWQKVGETQEIAKQKKEQTDRLSREIQELEKQENSRHRQMIKLASQNKETATLAKQAKLADGLYKAASELIEWRIEERKQTIEARTSEIHRRVTNKPREYKGVKIQSDYTLGIKNALGEILDPETLSAGEKEALAFAFIAGLNLASGTAAPLVMDTPFGHLDAEHQKNLIDSLPEIPSQVIVLATDRDLPENLLNSLRPHVAEIFKLARLDANKDASIVEVQK
jgi:DNA sulfur modification protein DndD